MANSRGSLVDLVAIDDGMLERVVLAATTDASADDVTPPLTPANTWTPQRIVWLRKFHRDCRAGIDGKARQATWALVADERVMGCIRLARTADRDVFETGIWVTRTARGRGVGRSAVAAVVCKAARLGAGSVVAETTALNLAALGVLRGVGFLLHPADASGRVRAVRPIGPGDALARVL